MDIPGVVSAVRLSVLLIRRRAESSDATIFPQPLRVPERAHPPKWIWSLRYPLFPSFQAAAAASCSLPSRRVGEWTPHRSGCSTATVSETHRSGSSSSNPAAALFHKLRLVPLLPGRSQFWYFDGCMWYRTKKYIYRSKYWVT
jgi:hypothetical protein